MTNMVVQIRRGVYCWDEDPRKVLKGMKEMVMCCPMFTSLDFAPSLMLEDDALGVGTILDLIKNGHQFSYERNFL